MYELGTALFTVSFYVAVGLGMLLVSEGILAFAHVLERRKQRQRLDRIRRP
jgi:hypothetical protein